MLKRLLPGECGKDKLKTFAQRLGLDTSGDSSDIALDLCDFIEADFNRKADQPSLIVEALAPEERKQTWQKLDMGIENLKYRQHSVKPMTDLPKHEAIVVFSTESIVEALGGTLDPLLEAIKNGTIKGVAGFVSCTTLRDHGQDVHSVRMARELIKRDILVLSMGCGNAALQVGDLCSPNASEHAGPGLKRLCESLKIPPVLSYGTCRDTGRIADMIAAVSKALGDVPVPDLPLVAVAPEFNEGRIQHTVVPERRPVDKIEAAIQALDEQES